MPRVLRNPIARPTRLIGPARNAPRAAPAEATSAKRASARVRADPSKPELTIVCSAGRNAETSPLDGFSGPITETTRSTARVPVAAKVKPVTAMSNDIPVSTISGRSVRLSRVTSRRLVAEPSSVAVVTSPTVRPLKPRESSSGARLADMMPSPTARRPRVTRIERVSVDEFPVNRSPG